MSKQMPPRRSAASRLRDLADRLERQGHALPSRLPAPLVRLGGTWWHRDEIARPALAEDVLTDAAQASDGPN